MTDAGADVVVAHMGLTTQGRLARRRRSRSRKHRTGSHGYAMPPRSVRRDVLVLCHGGPMAEPDDAEYVLSRTPGVDGFLGASSIERLATERAIETETRRFRELRLAGRRTKTSRRGR